MAQASVTALSSVEIGVRDVDAAARFYTETWGLTPVATESGTVYLRGTGANHHILALHPRPASELIRVAFQAPDKDAVDALFAKAKGIGVTVVTEPGSIARPGGGYGFDFKDKEERILRIETGVEQHRDGGEVADTPLQLAHVVLNSADADDATALFIDALGFRLSDKTRMFNFIRCNRYHHSVAFAYGKASTLNHVAFEMPDLESVMRGAGNVRDSGYPIEWGVGRHGPGANVFAYFIGPEDFVIEYTGEVELVDDDYKVGGPDDWKWPPGRVDRWGVSDPPSERIKVAQELIKFAQTNDLPG